mmetsp:Transcript_26078/g.34878  ORF Transcript_26078/g.34878 Transcript_26078/m.34878 type:complete len:95 (+) Transcript_26078:2507-2791(+)
MGLSQAGITPIAGGGNFKNEMFKNVLRIDDVEDDKGGAEDDLARYNSFVVGASQISGEAHDKTQSRKSSVVGGMAGLLSANGLPPAMAKPRPRF